MTTLDELQQKYQDQVEEASGLDGKPKAEVAQLASFFVLGAEVRAGNFKRKNGEPSEFYIYHCQSGDDQAEEFSFTMPAQYDAETGMKRAGIREMIHLEAANGTPCGPMKLEKKGNFWDIIPVA